MGRASGHSRCRARRADDRPDRRCARPISPAYLRDRQALLLLLDNVEQVLDYAPRLAELSRWSSSLKLLDDESRATPPDAGAAVSGSAVARRRRSLVVPRAGSRRPARLRVRRRRRRDLPPARRPPARDRAGSRPREAPAARRSARPAGAAARAPHGRCPGRCPSGSRRCGRRSTGASSCSTRPEQEAHRPAVGVRRRLDASRPRGRLRCGAARRSPRSSTRASFASETAGSRCSRRSASSPSSASPSSDPEGRVSDDVTAAYFLAAPRSRRASTAMPTASAATSLSSDVSIGSGVEHDNFARRSTGWHDQPDPEPELRLVTRLLGFLGPPWVLDRGAVRASRCGPRSRRRGAFGRPGTGVSGASSFVAALQGDYATWQRSSQSRRVARYDERGLTRADSATPTIYAGDQRGRSSETRERRVEIYDPR